MILQTLFWHLNTALINLLFPKKSLNLQISILFMEELFIIFFLFFYIHDVLWRDCLEICRIIIPIDIIQIFFFVSVFVSLKILCEKANKKTQPKSLIPPATIAQ